MARSDDLVLRRDPALARGPSLFAKALQAFYRDAFGWEVVPAGPSYAMVHPQVGSGINGGVGVAPEGGGSRVTVSIEVDDSRLSP